MMSWSLWLLGSLSWSAGRSKDIVFESMFSEWLVRRLGTNQKLKEQAVREKVSCGD